MYIWTYGKCQHVQFCNFYRRPEHVKTFGLNTNRPTYAVTCVILNFWQMLNYAFHRLQSTPLTGVSHRELCFTMTMKNKENNLKLTLCGATSRRSMEPNCVASGVWAANENVGARDGVGYIVRLLKGSVSAKNCTRNGINSSESIFTIIFVFFFLYKWVLKRFDSSLGGLILCCWGRRLSYCTCFT